VQSLHDAQEVFVLSDQPRHGAGGDMRLCQNHSCFAKKAPAVGEGD